MSIGHNNKPQPPGGSQQSLNADTPSESAPSRFRLAAARKMHRREMPNTERSSMANFKTSTSLNQGVESTGEKYQYLHTKPMKKQKRKSPCVTVPGSSKHSSARPSVPATAMPAVPSDGNSHSNQYLRLPTAPQHSGPHNIQINSTPESAYAYLQPSTSADDQNGRYMTDESGCRLDSHVLYQQ